MNSTDATIEVICGECEQVEVGREAMVFHILETHKQYNAHEAEVYADKWMEESYDKEDEQNYTQLSAGQKKAYRADQHGR